MTEEAQKPRTPIDFSDILAAIQAQQVTLKAIEAHLRNMMWMMGIAFILWLLGSFMNFRFP